MKPFLTAVDLPRCEKNIQRHLLSPLVKRIHSFVLGPAGTNISQASDQWLKRMGLWEKSSTQLCITPEESLEKALMVTAAGEMGLFWTCAVYFKLNELFFRNPDVLPFFVQERMALDRMQLATRQELMREAQAGFPKAWTIASHLSPSPLILDTGCGVRQTNSNAAAAELCASGQTELCVTTESARMLHGLRTVFEFGSPEMIFFGGITQSGIQLIREVSLSFPKSL